MEIRATFPPDGNPSVETVSTLEDLWHDFLFFKQRGAERDVPGASAGDELIAKRFRRAALLMLMFYFEGVLNNWLKHLLAEIEWPKVERKSLEQKLKTLQKRVAVGVPPKPSELADLKNLRNALAHLKPGTDLELYDGITAELLERTEATITKWLSATAAIVGIPPHPDTKHDSRWLRRALGTTMQEGHSAPPR